MATGRNVARRAAPVGVLAIVIAHLAAAAYAADDSSLSAALQRGDEAIVKRALSEGLNVNAVLSDGAPPLHWAVAGGHSNVVRLLLQSGANPNTRSVYGRLPLELAVQNGDSSTTELLLHAGANAREANQFGETVLMKAARTGSVPTLQALLAAGAEVNAADKTQKQTALMWAAAEGGAEAVNVLLKAGADITAKTRQKNSALFFAVRKGDIDSVKALVTAGANVNERIAPVPAPSTEYDAKYPTGSFYSDTGDSMLVVAILNGHFTLAQELVSMGADVNATGTNWTPLHALAMVRNYEEAQFPPPSISGDSLALAQTLISHGADVNARGTSLTPRRPGGDQNYNDIRGATPFLFTAKAGDQLLMKMLLTAHADATISTFEGTSPLMMASGLGCVPGQWIEDESSILGTVKFLIETLGADVNATNQHNETALHGAVCRGANSVIQYLVEHGARLDVKDEDGLTPLELAEKGADRAIGIKGPRVIKIRFPVETVRLMRELTAQANREHP